MPDTHQVMGLLATPEAGLCRKFAPFSLSAQWLCCEISEATALIAFINIPHMHKSDTAAALQCRHRVAKTL